MAICLSCRQGFCSECGDCICCEKASSNEVEDFFEEMQLENTNRRTGARKSDEDVKDPKSTGRKRAAVLYPLDLDAPCEWRGLKQAGGGKHPIIGCRDGLQRTRHHGPDKSTLNNESGNVSRICFNCHSRWHFKNDADYVREEYSNLPHDPLTKATLEEMFENELYWSRNKPKQSSPNSD